MGMKLYVGNLPYSVVESQLHELFTQVGTVNSAKIITDRDSGRSKGFAFIEMSENSEAHAAIQKLNGAQLDGRAISVSEAKPQAPRTGGFSSGGFGSRR